MRYTTERLEAIAEKLRNMPPPVAQQKHYSKQGAVRVLVKEIITLQKRGYTLEQISETLRGEGLDIATPTLKSYMQRAKQTTRKKAQVAEKSERRADTAKATAKATFTIKPDSDDI